MLFHYSMAFLLDFWYLDIYDEAYWDSRYLHHRTRWDMGAVSPPLKAYIDQLTNTHLQVLIPGCGNAYEAVYLLEKGFSNVTLVDISGMLTNQLRQRLSGYGDRLHIIHDDFFRLNTSFDLILEQTFFCSLDRSLRQDYAHKMHQLLHSSGKLAGVLFNRYFEEKEPPFGGNEEEYRQLFAPLFTIKTMSPCYNSIPPRSGTELFFILQKKQSFPL